MPENDEHQLPSIRTTSTVFVAFILVALVAGVAYLATRSEVRPPDHPTPSASAAGQSRPAPAEPATGYSATPAAARPSPQKPADAAPKSETRRQIAEKLRTIWRTARLPKEEAKPKLRQMLAESAAPDLRAACLKKLGELGD